MEEINVLNDNTGMWVIHILILVMNLGLVILLFLNRGDRLNYERNAKSEREYIMQLFSQAINKMSVLIARVEENINNGKHE